MSVAAAQRAVDAVFRQFGEAALYRVGGADPSTPVTVIPNTAEAVDSPFEANRVAASTVYELRVSEIAQPGKTDTIELELTGETLRVGSFNKEDTLGLVWTLTLEAIP